MKQNLLKKDGTLKQKFLPVIARISEELANTPRGDINVKGLNSWNGRATHLRAHDGCQVYCEFLRNGGIDRNVKNDSPRGGFVHNYVNIPTSERRKLRALIAWCLKNNAQ